MTLIFQQYIKLEKRLILLIRLTSLMLYECNTMMLEDKKTIDERTYMSAFLYSITSSHPAVR